MNIRASILAVASVAALCVGIAHAATSLPTTGGSYTANFSLQNTSPSGLIALTTTGLDSTIQIEGAHVATFGSPGTGSFTDIEAGAGGLITIGPFIPALPATVDISGGDGGAVNIGTGSSNSVSLGGSGGLVIEPGGPPSGNTLDNIIIGNITPEPITATIANITTEEEIAGTPLGFAVAPTIASGFGTGATVLNNNGTFTFVVNVGAGGVAYTGTVGLPAAKNGWNCTSNDITTQSPSVFLTKQTADTTTSASFTNYNTAGEPTAWADSDKLGISCQAF